MPQIVAGLVLALFLPALAAAQTTYAVSDEAALRTALTSAIAGDTIVFGSNITLTADLPNVGASVTIDGGGYSLSGNSQYRGLFIESFVIPMVGGPPAPTPVAVTIQNLTIRDTVATGGSGGAGGPGGGGGAGMGGALFVGELATVSVSNVNLISNAAVGGAGGTGGLGDVEGGGGGGLGGNGGAGNAATGSGGGGGIGVGASGGGPELPGLPGIITGVLGPPVGGGGGAGSIIDVAGAATGGITTNGGNFGGGGGGGWAANNFGGFGGGGGGTPLGDSPNFGAGGYGGGGGGTTGASANLGGTFGGDGGTLTTRGGGGGAGLGGAIFVQAGGNLTVGGGFTINGAAVTGGAGSTGGVSGSAAGSGIFFQGSDFYSLSFAPSGSQTATVAGDIADEFGVLGSGGSLGVSMDGTGTLVLSGNNAYSGGTSINFGTLSVSSDANLGAAGSGLYGSADTTLRITASGIFSRTFYMNGGTQNISVASGQTATWSGQIGSEGGAALNVTGGGTLVLTDATNWWAAGTSVNGNSRLVVGLDGALGSFDILDPTIGTVTLGDATTGGTLGIDATSVGNVFSSGRVITLQSGGGTIDTVGASDATLSGAIGGGGSLTKDGTGLLTLSGDNTYTGATSVNAGILRAGSVTAFGNSTSLSVGASGTADFNGFDQTFFTVGGTGTVELNGAAALTVGGDNSSSSFGGTFTGTGGLFKTGSGAWTLSGTNDFTGGIVLNAGTLSVATDANLGGAGAIAMNNATTIGLTGSGTFAHGLQIEGTSSMNLGTGLSATWSGLVGDFAGAGTLRVTGGGLFALTNAANSYTGGSIVTGGSTLQIGADGALGAAGTGVTLGDATTGGALEITTTGFSTSRAVTLQAGGGAINTGGAIAATLGGAIGGTGALAKTGAGALTLSGINTFTGGLALNAGTLNAAADANLGGAGAVAMSNATTLGLTANGTFAHGLRIAGTSTLNAGAGQSVTWSGLVTDNASAGTLRLTGGGLFALTNANTYTGGTIVTGGTTLQVGADSALGAAGGSLALGDATTGGTLGITTTGFSTSRAFTLQAGGGTIDTGGAVTATLGGVISGTGTLIKTGTGRLTLSGANTFTGGITVNGGALWGTTSSLRGNIFSNTQVDFDQTTSGTYGGVLSGGGALFKTGIGALTLSGANTYTGGTFLNGGSIIGSTNSLQGSVVDNGELVFNQAFNGAFRGVITGLGNVTKLGLGTVSLSGAQGYTGLTWIREGALAIDALLPGSVKVDSAGTLLAAGTIGGSIDLAGGLVVPAPGSQFATFTPTSADASLLAGTQFPSLLINGNLTTTAGSTIGLTVSPGGAAPLLVNGTANLTGTHFNVNINSPTSARATTFAALTTTGGLRMTGADISSPSTTLVPVLRPGPFALMVTLLNYALPLRNAARTPNAIQVATGVDAGKSGATGDFANVVNELTALDDAHLDLALRAMAGEIHASTARLVALDSLSITDMVRNELSNVEHDWKDGARPSGAGAKPRFWIQLSGDHASFSSGIFSGGTGNVGGGGGGVDFKPGSDWTVGAGLSLTTGGLSLTDLSETSTMIAPRAFTYFGFSFGPFNVHWGGSLARSTTTTKRHIQFEAFVPDASGQLVPLSGGIDRDATSDQVSTTRDAWSDWQFTRKVGTWTFDGKLGLRAANYSRKEFNEDGADSISLDVHTQTLSTREFNIDLHHFRRTGTWLPNILLTYRREFGDDWTRAKANFAANPITQFSVQGMPVPLDTFQGVLGLTMRSGSGLLYTLEYQFLHSSDESRHSVRFKVRF
ncbi:MAG: autotransporter-associated beta strand repeat-containing protein [Acidobacteria bacterium]|nr:autotransporter-associated beta strand repeat-containing protein [Acidobacteriota bacterium]